jgi:archaellum component FlaC
MAMDVETEIRDLKRRVSELEGSFGFLTRQIGDVHRDLLAFQSETDQRFDSVQAEIREVRTEVRGLRQALPGIVADTMREVLAEQRRKT